MVVSKPISFDADTITKAAKISTAKGVSLSKYISAILEKQVEKDYPKFCENETEVK